MLISKKYYFQTFFFFWILLMVFAPNVSASTDVNRIAGYDRYQTAVAASQAGWPDGADSVILAYGENFPDALSAGPLARKYNAPILLTGSNDLNSDTILELKRLKVKKIYIVGGTAVVSANIEKQLSLMKIAYIRLAGSDRYETALKVAQEVGVRQGIFVTTGLDFPDALSIAPIAAAKGMPIILVPPDELTITQKSFLSKNKITNGFIVTGQAELSDKVVSQFSNFEVIQGVDPYERNINLIKRFAGSLDLDTFYLATGENFPDALTSSALAQKGQHAIILLRGNTIPDSVLGFIKSKIISNLKILGGNSVISDATKNTLASLPAQIVSVINVYDSIQEKQTYEPPKTITVTTTNGLKEEVAVTWSLSAVQTLLAGIYQFEGKLNNYHGSVYLSLRVNPIVAKVDTTTAEIILGGYYRLPTTVTVTMSDGTVKPVPVVWNNNIITLNKIGSYTFQGKAEGLAQTVSLNLKVSEDAKVELPDLRLKSVVGGVVGKNLDETIYKSDIINISVLDASNSGITDLTGLENFSNLKTLYLSNNNLVKVTSLTKLTNLVTLKLKNSELKDLAALKGLSLLTYLDVSDNYIKDFSPMKDFTRLTALYLSGNIPLVSLPYYTPDYSSVRLFYKNLTWKDFSL